MPLYIHLNTRYTHLYNIIKYIELPGVPGVTGVPYTSITIPGIHIYTTLFNTLIYLEYLEYLYSSISIPSIHIYTTLLNTLNYLEYLGVPLYIHLNTRYLHNIIKYIDLPGVPGVPGVP